VRIIGITGGVGSGKTAILKQIKDLYNCEVIYADEAAHLLKEPGRACYPALIDLLGQRILDADGRINRAKMAEIIFADERLLAKVNQIIHPAVKKYIEDEIAVLKEKNEIGLLFIEAALLIEDGYDKIVDELWYIYADAEVRLKRLKEKRGYSFAKARKIMASQLADDAFRAKCQVVIDNNQETELAVKQIASLIEFAIRQ
jgi:dephospho-CoA kinase